MVTLTIFILQRIQKEKSFLRFKKKKRVRYTTNKQTNGYLTNREKERKSFQERDNFKSKHGTKVFFFLLSLCVTNTHTRENHVTEESN